MDWNQSASVAQGVSDLCLCDWSVSDAENQALAGPITENVFVL